MDMGEETHWVREGHFEFIQVFRDYLGLDPLPTEAPVTLQEVLLGHLTYDYIQVKDICKLVPDKKANIVKSLSRLRDKGKAKSKSGGWALV